MGITKQRNLFCITNITWSWTKINTARAPRLTSFSSKVQLQTRYTSTSNCLETHGTAQFSSQFSSLSHLVNPVERVLWLEMGVWEWRRVFLPPGVGEHCSSFSRGAGERKSTYLKSTLSHKLTQTSRGFEDKDVSFSRLAADLQRNYSPAGGILGSQTPFKTHRLNCKLQMDHLASSRV